MSYELFQGETMAYQIGIDVGGTFTDFLLMDDRGEAEIFKVLSTPQDPSIAVLNCLREMAGARRRTLEAFARQAELVVHGTTVSTNAVLTRRGARTALITTRGFRDILYLRRGYREERYNNRVPNPIPLVPRHLRQTVAERIDSRGEVLEPLGREGLREAIASLERKGVEAVALCFLHAYIKPVHEEEAAPCVREGLPGRYLTLSSRLLRQIRLYDRVSTTVMNSYVGPIIERYLENLASRLLAAVAWGERRLLEVIEKYGLQKVRSHMDYVLEATERRMRAEIQRIPDGVYRGESWLRFDGITPERRHRVAVSVTVAGDELTVDFTGTDPQTPGSANAPESCTRCSVMTALLMLVDPDILHNQGILRPVRCVIPRGTLLNADFPAATTMGNHLSDQILEAILQALTDALPQRVVAGWNRHLFPILTGVDPRTGEPFSELGFFAMKGGGGATYGCDGYDHIGIQACAGGVLAQDPEMHECQAPQLQGYPPRPVGRGRLGALRRRRGRLRRPLRPAQRTGSGRGARWTPVGREGPVGLRRGRRSRDMGGRSRRNRAAAEGEINALRMVVNSGYRQNAIGVGLEKVYRVGCAPPMRLSLTCIEVGGHSLPYLSIGIDIGLKKIDLQGKVGKIETKRG